MRSLLVALTALGVLAVAPLSASATPGPTGPGDVHPELGTTTGHDGQIRKGCRTFTYDYAVTPPEGYWALETFIIGPDGDEYGSGFFLTGSDPLAGPGTFKLCRRSSPGGTYTIRARVTVGDNTTYVESGWLADSTFKLKKTKKKR